MDFKICPKCNSNHSNKGRFCSRTCANSRTFSPESRLKKSIQNKKYYINLTEEEKQQKKEYYKKCLKNHGENPNKRAARLFLLQSDTINLKRQSIRRKVILEQNNKCFICEIFEWQNKPISLQLDHIDGNKFNNERQNLRALCPNCHSQTETFAGKNRKYKQE